MKLNQFIDSKGGEGFVLIAEDMSEAKTLKEFMKLPHFKNMETLFTSALDKTTEVPYAFLLFI